MHLYSERRLRTSLELFKIKPVGDVENSIHQHFRKLQLDRIQIKKKKMHIKRYRKKIHNNFPPPTISPNI